MRFSFKNFLLSSATAGLLLVTTLCAAQQATLIPYTIKTVAGTIGTQGSSTDGGAATSAAIVTPYAVAVDASGNIYFTDASSGKSNKIRKVDPTTGIISTAVGTASLNGVRGMFSSGNILYITDYSASSVLKYDPSTNTTTKILGNSGGCMVDSYGNASPAVTYPIASTNSLVKFWNPTTVAADASGNLYIADTKAQRIRKAVLGTPSMVSNFAGANPCTAPSSAPVTGFAGDGALADSSTVRLNSPQGLTVDSVGNVYISDKSNCRVRKVTAATGIISTIAGNGSCSYSTSQGPALSTPINPVGLAVDRSDNLYVADANGAIWFFDSAANYLRIIAGAGTACGGAANSFGDGCPATQASLNSPFGIAFDGAGNLYIADMNNHAVRKVSLGTQFPSTYSGISVTQNVRIHFAAGETEVSGSFAIANGNGFSIAANGQCTTNADNTRDCVIPVTFSPSTSGTYTATAQVSTIEPDNSSKTLTFALSGQATTPPPPTVDSVTPANSSGNPTGPFVFQYSDLTGYGSITYTQGIFNTAIQYSDSCSFNYNPAKNLLYLNSDAGAWMPPKAVGQSGVLSNGRCSINVGASSASGSGNTLTLSLAITFADGWAGPQNIYSIARNNYGSSGWVTSGSWTPAAAIVSTPPTVSTTTPAAAGPNQVLSFQYTSPNGYRYISWAQGIFNLNVAYGKSCSFFYNRLTNYLYVNNDAGTAWVGPVPVGAAGTLQNSQCSIDVAKSSVIGSGNVLTLNLAVSANSSFLGTFSNFGLVVDQAGLKSGWVGIGSWTPNVIQAVPPSVGALTIADTVAGTPQTIGIQFSSANGGDYITWVQAIIGDKFGYGNSCSVYYHRPTKTLFLQSNAGDTWMGRIPLGNAGTLQNDQCSINVANASETLSGNTMTLNLPVSFTNGFAGTKNVWGFALDNANARSNWQVMGSFNITQSAQPTTSVTVDCNNGPGTDFTTIQDAVNWVNTTGGIVNIRPCTYTEVVNITGNNVQLRGKGTSPSDVVITYNNTAVTPSPAGGAPLGTSNSSTVTVTGANFYAENLTMQNSYNLGPLQAATVTQTSLSGNVATFTANNNFSAGQWLTIKGCTNGGGILNVTPSTGGADSTNSRVVSATATQFTIAITNADLAAATEAACSASVGQIQAVALKLTGDRAVLRNVRLLGRQDTLYAANASTAVASRQYFYNAYVEGNVDFIFGDSKAVFDNSTIMAVPHPDPVTKSDNQVVFTAQSKVSATEPSGYVFTNSTFASDPTWNYTGLYLGRPWRQYSTVVIMNSNISAQVNSAGWLEWSGQTYLPYATYAEYNTTGQGSASVAGSNREQYAQILTAAQAAQYSTQSFLSGSDNWDPTTVR